MGHQERSALTKFKCHVSPLAIETGHYSNIPVKQRLCSLCDLNVVENKMHVLLFCPLYADITSDLYKHCCANVLNFMQMSVLEIFLLYCQLRTLYITQPEPVIKF